MVPRSGPRAGVPCGQKLQCLRARVRQIARERDKARLDWEKAERRCLRLGRELEEQYLTLEHAQSKLRDVNAEIEARELLLQQAVNHQMKLEADARFLQDREASLQGRLDRTVKENMQLQNKVTEMAEKLAASEELVLDLQKEVSCIVKDKLSQVEPHSPELPNQHEWFAEIVLEYERQCQVLWEQNGALRRELEQLRWQQSRTERGLPAAGASFSMEHLQEGIEMEQGGVGQQHSEETHHPGQQLDQEGEEARTQHRDRGSLRGELCWLLEENRLLKSQLERLQQELRLAKEKGSGCKEKGVSEVCREKVEELAEAAGRTASSEPGKGEVSHLDVRMCQLGRELPEHEASHGAGPGTARLQSQRLVEAERLQGAETATGLELHQQHAACWVETELLRQQLKASQDKLLEAKASLSLAQTRHALQLQQAKAQLDNMVPKQQFEQLRTSLRGEQCKAQQLHQQLEECERLLQAAAEQAEGLEQSLRSAEAVLAERVAQLEDAQAQLSRNKLLIRDLHKENKGFAMALQAAELKQKSTEEKNQLLEEQASALKQLIRRITPASLSG